VVEDPSQTGKYFRKAGKDLENFGPLKISYCKFVWSSVFNLFFDSIIDLSSMKDARYPNLFSCLFKNNPIISYSY